MLMRPARAKQTENTRGFMAHQNSPKPTKAERTAAAREKARQMREAQQKREKRNSLLVKGGVVVAVLVIIGVIAAVVITNQRGQIADAGAAPAHGNANGGITITQNGLADTDPVNVDVANIPEPASTEGDVIVPAGVAAAPKGEPASIVMYVDMGCPVCKSFEGQYGEYLTELTSSGDATVEYRVATFLDRVSTTNYSSRAANAVACVADSSPEVFNDYLTQLFAQQPAEGGAGLDNATLTSIAETAGATDVSSCIDDGEFRPWAKFVNQTFSDYQVGGTPTVYVDGQKWDPNTAGDFQQFAQGVIDARA